MLSYSRQTIDDEDIASVLRALQSDFLTCGQEVTELEKELAAYCGSQYAVVCANGTAALHLACLALGIRSGQSIITSPLTFLASGNCALFCGADVRFADIDSRTLCLDPVLLEKMADEIRPSAVIPVHFGGGTADLLSISRIAKRGSFSVIEDGCHALGTEYKDEEGKWRRVGSCSHSEMAVFSFHPVKHITTGEGGAITTNRLDLYERLVALRSHGVERNPANWKNTEQGFDGGLPNPWYHEMQSLGWNYRLTDLQSSLGRSQLKKLDRFVSRRRRLAALYRTVLFETRSPANPAFEKDTVGHSYHLFPVLVPFSELGKSRGDVMRSLKSEGISPQVHYIPLYRQPYYQERYGYSALQFPNSEHYYQQCLSLPLFPTMEDQDVQRVVETLNKVLCDRRF